jgi:two-component system CheB/CheR fusion protein
MRAARKGCPLQIFASDIDADALEVGRAGVYPENIAADVPPERLRRFFLKGEHGYRVNKELRDAVVFAQQNLVSDPPFSRLDLISCRNLLIYLEPTAQEKILSLLHFALAEGGYLFLGNTESIGQHEDLFAAVSKKWRVYRRLGPTRHDKVPFPIVSAPPVGRERVSPTPPNVGRLAALAQHLLLERYVPACVVINRKREILYFHGRTEDYLVQPTGSPTQDLVAKAREGLQTKLRGAVHKAIREEHSVVISGAHVRRGRTFCRVKVMVEPLKAATEAEGLLLVSFEDESETPSSAPAVAHAGDASDRTDEALVRQLEYELRTTKEDLQSTIDELGASNEELRAANEEVMSINEELQSSNEELETSKEELQSLNEELSTVNTQLESKVAELAAINNDLDNLLTSTNLATLFLDTHLCIRRFTPAATKLFSLIPSDAGRPISDIAQKFADPDLRPDVEAVLAEPVARNKEVQADDGRWYIRQVLPYRTHDNRTDGAVITFSDVAAEAREEARLYAESIVETVREPLLVLNGDLRVRSANRSFYDTFQISQEQTVGRPIYELGNHDWDTPGLRELLENILPRHLVLNDFEVEHEFQTIGWRSMLLNARALLRGGGRPGLILLAIEDVTERKRAQEAILESEVRKQVEEERRQQQAELAHVLRIATIGELASGLAHELNQPLSAIANGLEACARYVRSGEPDSTKLLALLDDASAEALRTGEIVEHLRGSIQKGQPQFGQTDLGEIARAVPRLLKHEIEQEQITLRFDVGPHPLPIYADHIQIEQVLVNLVQNAIDAVRDTSRDRKEIQLSACTVEGMVEAAVRDTGVGISAAAAARLFEPFFTTKPRGLGMGLAISRSIIEAHRGRIWVERPADGNLGTTVRFTLPLHAPTPAGKRRST